MEAFGFSLRGHRQVLCYLRENHMAEVVACCLVLFLLDLAAEQDLFACFGNDRALP